MPGFLALFGLGGSHIKKALQQGATIIDVRSAHDFDNGHIPNSINIPYRELDRYVSKLTHYSAGLIICCDGNGKSTIAVDILKKAGIKNVIDGGKWRYVLHIYQKLVG